MSTSSLTTVATPASPRVLLLDRIDNKDAISRIGMFAEWLTTTGERWDEPDLAAYRDHLMTAYTGRNGRPLTAASAAAHLSTIRGRYGELLTDNRTLDIWEQLAALECERYGIDPNPANVQAAVARARTRLENAINPRHSAVKVVTRRDAADSAHIRLTYEQANALLDAPFNHRTNTPLQTIRDAAILAVMLCTGVREMELCNLEVQDLRQQLGGALALHVREGKGMVERLIPYGSGEWCLAYVDKWRALAGIDSGAVFRGFYKGGKKVRPTRLDVSSIHDILNRYPVMIDGELIAINPHDTRRTYARRAYDMGLGLLAIQQNLGHSDSRITERYIGTLDASARKPPSMYKPPRLNELERLSF